MEDSIIHSEQVWYRFFLNSIFYVYCPKSMQTKTLAESIFNDYNWCNFYYYKCNEKEALHTILGFIQDRALKYVNFLFDTTDCIEQFFLPSELKVENIDTFNVLDFLKDYARSEKVKNYLDL